MLRITDWLMRKLGAPESEIVYWEVERECDAWNLLYADGKRCEKCGCEPTNGQKYGMKYGSVRDSHSGNTYSFYECPACEKQQAPFRYSDGEARWRYGVSSWDGYHYTGILTVPIFLLRRALSYLRKIM